MLAGPLVNPPGYLLVADRFQQAIFQVNSDTGDIKAVVDYYGFYPSVVAFDPAKLIVYAAGNLQSIDIYVIYSKSLYGNSNGILLHATSGKVMCFILIDRPPIHCF